MVHILVPRNLLLRSCYSSVLVSVLLRFYCTITIVSLIVEDWVFVEPVKYIDYNVLSYLSAGEEEVCTG